MTPCATPTSFETIVDWWTGALSAVDAAAFEEHLFACDACGEAAARLSNLMDGVREHIPPIISRAQRERLVAAGNRIRTTPIESGIDARVFFGRDVEFLVHALRADLSRAERVDVEIVVPELDGPIVCEGVPFDAAAGEVLVCCQRHFQDLSDPTFRVHAYSGGERRPVGEYFVQHEWE